MIRPLEYGLELSLEHAETRYKGVVEEFRRIKSAYSGLLRGFEAEIEEDDHKSLTNCVQVLLALSLVPSVQAQAMNGAVHEHTLHYRSSVLLNDVMMYAARFTNTGVTVLEGRLD